MPALGVKVAAVAGAALVLLVPAFNSLNQVTVEDAEPPFTVDDPPPNLPPPEEGDDFQVPPPAGAEGEQCPPPVLEERAAWSWDFPQQPQTTTQSFIVSPGSAGLAYAGNLSNFVGKVTVTLIDPEDAPTDIFEFDSADANAENGQRVGNRRFGGQFPGVAPGPWELRVVVGDDVGALGVRQPATGHFDVQLYEGFPCGGAGSLQAPASPQALRAQGGAGRA